jgi:chromosome segregation ATPase
MRARILSPEEMEVKERMQTIDKKIKALKNEISERKKKLEQRKEIQEHEGKKVAEVEITDELIQEKLDVFRNQITKLQKEYSRLNELLPEVTKHSQNQGSLGL